MPIVKWYVDQVICGKTVSTQFDTKVAAEKYANRVGGSVRPPKEALSSSLSEKLFAALSR